MFGDHGRSLALAALMVTVAIRPAAQQQVVVHGRVEIGGWQRVGESPAITSTRNATVVTVESELSFAYTKLAGEWVRDAIETSSGTRVASGWFVLGQQTLAPRWFVAGRVERIASPLVVPIGVVPQRYAGWEEVLGYRATPEFTLRGGHRATWFRTARFRSSD